MSMAWAARASKAISNNTFVKIFWSKRTLLEERLVLSVYSVLSGLVLAIMVYYHAFACTTDAGVPDSLSCRSVLWAGGTACGINGIDCAPFETDEWTPIRCPSRCSWSDASLVVYGSGPYHASSRICTAAVHAGVIDSTGGAALLRLSGSQSSFPSSSAHGVHTETFDSWFPSSFEFQELPSQVVHHCGDLGVPILCVGLILMAIGSSLRPPKALLFAWFITFGYYYVAFVATQSSDPASVFITSTARMFLVATFGFGLYRLGAARTLFSTTSITVSNVASPRADSATEESLAPNPVPQPELEDLEPRPALGTYISLRATATPVTGRDDGGYDLGCESARSAPSQQTCSARLRLRVASLCAPAQAKDSPLSPAELARTHPFWKNFVLYFLPMVLALHLNLITYVVPDIDLDSGVLSHGDEGAAVLGLGGTVFAVLALYHFWLARRAGVLRSLLVGYLLLVIAVVMISLVFASSHSLHLHHVFLPIVAWPATGFPNRPVSAVSQGLLAGVWLNGLAAWGWSANWDRVRSSFPKLRPEPPYLVTNTTASNITIGWQVQLDLSGSERDPVAISLMMNDVEMVHAPLVAQTAGVASRPHRYFDLRGRAEPQAYAIGSSGPDSSRTLPRSLTPSAQPARHLAVNQTFTHTQTGLPANTTVFFYLNYIFQWGARGPGSRVLWVSTVG